MSPLKSTKQARGEKSVSLWLSQFAADPEELLSVLILTIPGGDRDDLELIKGKKRDEGQWPSGRGPSAPSGGLPGSRWQWQLMVAGLRI